MSARLPEDILAEILKQLPAKSLLRLRSVSRSWNSLITSGWFITLHLNHPVESTESWILLRHYLPTRPLLVETAYCGNGESFTEGQELELPTKTGHSHSYVGACNGLLCFSVYNIDYFNIIMWNPSTRTCFQVPMPRTVQMPHYFVGFGFDCRTGRYKVVTIIYVMGENCQQYQIPPQVEVFVPGTDKCRRVDIGVPFVIRSSQAFLHGAIHWIAYKPDNSRVILVFDVHEEVFQEIEIPSSIVHPNGKLLSVNVYADSLCLLEDDLYIASAEVPSFLFVWVMKQYGVKESWTKQFKIDRQDQWGLSLRMLGFGRHDTILLVNDNDELVSYDLKSGKVKLQVQGIQALGRPFKAIPFMESLVLLEGTDMLEEHRSSSSITGLKRTGPSERPGL